MQLSNQPPNAEPGTVHLDHGHNLPVFSSICTWCRHWRPESDRSCEAYPGEQAIPRAIWLGQHDHRTPYQGDNGIMFAPVDNVPVQE